MKRLTKKTIKEEYLKIFFIGILSVASNISPAQTWSLQQCIDTALVHNKQLTMSKNNISLAQQKQQESKANLIPKINITADYKYFVDLPYQLMPQSAFGGPEGVFKEMQFGVPHNIGANIQITMPLYNPQVYGAIQSTKIISELNQLQYKKTEEQLFFEISNLYYNVQILQHQLKFTEGNLANTGKLLKNMELLHEQLMVKQSDVDKVQLQKEQLTTSHKLIVANLEQVMNSLKFTMGISINQNIAIDSMIQYQENREYHVLPIVDLQIANTQSRLLTSELSTLKNSRFPTLSLYGSYGQNGFGYDEKPNDFLKFFPVSFAGLQISYPLFNGTITKRKIGQKKIEIENSRLQTDLVTEQNHMMTDNAKHRKTITQETIKNTLSQIDLATKVFEQTLLQQKEGTAGLTEVLLADSALREAQQNYLSAIVDYLRADLELKKLTGNISLTK